MRGEVMFCKTGTPGWVEVVFAGDIEPVRLLIKINSRNGRWGITNLIMVGDVDSSLLKSIPMARIEASLNGFGMGPELLKQNSEHLFQEEIEQIDSGLTSYVSRREKPVLWSDITPETGLPVTRQPLNRPDGSDPEAFYRRVATAYDDAVRRTGAPAKVLADEAGVPVATVHRWIHEARRRGYLPPARKGRAG